MRVTILFLLLSTTIASAQELSFSQAVQQMFNQNPALLQKKIGLQISENEANRTKSSYYPQVDFLQTITSSNNPVYAFGTLLNQQRFTRDDFAIDGLNEPSALTDISSRFQLEWLVYDFGRRESTISSANMTSEIAAMEEQSTRLRLLLELVRRYYALALVSQRLAVTTDAITTAESLLKQASDRVDQGFAVESDQLSAEVFHARRLQENIEAQNQRELAIAALSNLLGNSQNVAITTSSLSEKVFPDHPLDWWIEQMKAHRPEFAIVEASTRLASEQVDLQKSNFYPSLQAWSNYEWHGKSFSYTGDSWGAGLELRWNIFHGLSDRDQYAKAKLEQQSEVAKRKETEDSLSLEVKSGYYAFQSAKQKLIVSSKAVRQAQENRRIYSDRYNTGLVTIQDSLQAETAYNEARLLHSQNTYELYVAYAALLAAAGSENELEQIGGPQ